MNLMRIFCLLLLCNFSLLATGSAANKYLNPNVIFRGSTETGQPNSEATVKFTVENFTDIASMQWTIKFNPAIIQYIPPPGAFGLTGLDASSFNTQRAGEGIITFLWYDQQGRSVANGTIIYSIKFKLIGANGTFSNVEFSNTPLAIEIADKNAMKCAATTNNGRVNIGSIIEPTGLTIKAADANAAKDQEVCIPISVTGFKSINAMQFSLGWDTSRIKFTKIQNFAGLTSFDQSSFNLALTNSGKLVSVWFDPNTTGQTVADGTNIFEVCFRYTGPCPGSGKINFTDDPTKTVFNSTTGGSLSATKTSGTITASSCGTALSVSTSKITHPCPGQTNGAIEISTTGGTGTLTYTWTNNSTNRNLSGVGAGSYNVTVRDGAGTTATLAAAVNLTAVTVAATKKDPTTGQSNGEITLAVTGGNTNYTYKWSNNATTKDINNLAIGVYSYTVTDASNCAVSGTESLGTVGLDITSIVPVGPACAGQSSGSINITVVGGTGPYQFTWTGPSGFTASTEDISGLKSGTYKVTVKDAANLTKASDNIVLTEPANPVKVTARIKSVSSLGNDGEITPTATGGTAPYQYRWNTGSTSSSLTSLAKGNYGLTVTDSKGCTTSNAYVVGGMVDGECFTAQRAFTPNGDGINEVFVINCSETISNQLLVYNRWNQLVYRVSNYTNDWVGVDLKGFILPDGVYYWILKDNSGTNNTLYKGNVTLLRDLN